MTKKILIALISSKILFAANVMQAAEPFSCGVRDTESKISRAQLLQAQKIVTEYGASGTLSFEQMKLYYAVQISTSIDANKNGSLEYSEYIASLMYCTENGSTWACGTGSDAQYGKLAGIPTAINSKTKKLTALAKNLLTQTEGHWTTTIIDNASIIWQEAGVQKNESLEPAQLAMALSSLDATFAKVEKGKWLESEIEKEVIVLKNEVSPNEAYPFSVETALKKRFLCTSNRNRTLKFTYTEFKSLFDHPKSLDEFLKVVNQTGGPVGMSVSIEQLLDPLLFKVAPITHELFNRQISNDLTNIVEGTGPAEIDRIVENIADIERAADKAKKNRLQANEFGLPWIKDKGLVVAGGKTKYNTSKKEYEIDVDKPYLTLQFIEDFTSSGSSAKPATLSWTKPRGGSSVTDIDAAIRLDWYRPSWADLTDISFNPSFGFDYARSGINDDEQEQIEYYLLGDFAFNKSFGIIKANGLEFGPVYKEDKVERVDTLTGLVQWSPIVNIGGYVTGTQLPVTDNISFFFQPKLSYEFNDIRKQPIDSELEDADILIYNFISKLSIGERLSLEFEYTDRKEQNGLGRSFDFQEWELSWKLDKTDFYSLTLEYERGAIPPAFDEIDRFTFGLGVRF